MYCDICEEFDKHETEDCPQQTSDDVPADVKKVAGERKQVPARAYCDICEGNVKYKKVAVNLHTLCYSFWTRYRGLSRRRNVLNWTSKVVSNSYVMCIIYC